MKWKLWGKKEEPEEEQGKGVQGKLKATPTKRNLPSNLPPYLTQGIITQDPELKEEIERFLSSYQDYLKKLNKKEFALLIDDIYKYYQKAEKNTAKELLDLIQKLVSMREDQSEIIKSLQDKTLKTGLEKVKIPLTTIEPLTTDDLIKILSLRIGNQPQELMSIKEPLLKTALLLELKERGLKVDESLEDLYNTLDTRLQLSNIKGENADKFILSLIRNKLDDKERKIFDSIEGTTIEEKIKNAKNELERLKNMWEVPTESEIKNLKLLPNLVEKLENELKQINKKEVIAYYHLHKLIEKIDKERWAEFERYIKLNEPFLLEKSKLFKRWFEKSMPVAGALAASYILSYYLGPTENTLINMLIFGGGIGGGTLAITKGKSALEKLAKIPGWRAKVRVAGRDILWTVAGIGGLAFAVYYFGKAKDEQEKKVLGEFLKAIGLSKDGKTIDKDAIKEQLGITTEQLEGLVKFYSTEQGKSILAYLSGTINKSIGIPKTFDVNKLKAGLEEDNLGMFRPSKWLTSLVELQEKIKETKYDKKAIGDLLPIWKEKGYLFNSAQTILFEYGKLLGFNNSELEKIIINKDSAKNFADMLYLVYKGELPQSVAYFYYDLKYRKNSEEEAKKLLLLQPIQKGSAMEHFDRYTLYILLDPSKSKEEKEQALNNFKNTLEVYNKSETIRDRLSKIVEGGIIYGYVYGYISDKIQNSTTNSAFYYVANPILASIDRRFLDDVEAVKFVSDYGIIEWLYEKGKEKIKDDKINVINFYDFVKELQDDPVFKGMEPKDRNAWLDKQLEEGAYKKYMGASILMRTYNTFGTEIAPGLKKEETAGKGEIVGGRAPTTEKSKAGGGAQKGRKPAKTDVSF